MNVTVTVTGWVDPNHTIDDTEVILKSTSGRADAFTKFANKIFLWCADNNIEADLVGKWSDDENNDYSRWRISNELHRTMFRLVWS